MGNAVTDDYHDYIGTFEYWWTHGLISDSTYKVLRETCDTGSSTHPSDDCVKSLLLAEKEQGNIDPYSIYTPPCNASSSLRRRFRVHFVSFFLDSSNIYFCSCQNLVYTSFPLL